MTKNSTEISYQESFKDFATITKIFLTWVKRNMLIILVCQFLCFLIGFIVFAKTKSIVVGKAKIFTHHMPIHNLSPFFEALKDAEIQGKLEYFWSKGNYNNDGNDIKNIKLWIPERNQLKNSDPYHFYLEFEQNSWEPDTNSIARLNRIITPSILHIEKIKNNLDNNKKLKSKNLSYSNNINDILINHNKTLTETDFINLTKIKNYLYDLGKQNHANSILEISVKSLKKTKYKPKKLSIFSFLTAELFFTLILIFRYLITGK